MKRLILIALPLLLLTCSNCGNLSTSYDEKAQEYSSTAVTISDFSMKIVGYYDSKNIPIPKDFDKQQLFTLLGKIYPDQLQVVAVKNNYQVFVRYLDGGYSLMLCDKETNQKIMEDLSCHLNRVEIRSWENAVASTCGFEDNWQPYCR